MKEELQMSELPIDTNSPMYALHIAALVLSSDEKARMEKAANDMARKVDAIGPLDPLDVEPAVIFDPNQ